MGDVLLELVCANAVVGSRRQVPGCLLPAVVAYFPHGLGEGGLSFQVERRCAIHC